MWRDYAVRGTILDVPGQVQSVYATILYLPKRPDSIGDPAYTLAGYVDTDGVGAF